MEAEVLIKKVTREVLNRLKDQLTETQRILVVIPKYAENSRRILQYIAADNPSGQLSILTYNPEINLNLPVKYSLLDISDIQIQNQIITKLTDYNAVYCISPNIKLLENLHSLDDSHFVEWLIIHGMLNYLEVTIIIDHDFKRENLNKVEKKVKDLLKGISQLDILVENINCSNVTRDQENKQYGPGKVLITEQQVEKMYRDGVKDIKGKEAIITPLAYDKARELGIRVIY